MPTPFHKNKHNLLYATAPVSGINTVFSHDTMLSASAYFGNHSGTAINQPQGTAEFIQAPGISAEVRPPGSLNASGYTDYWLKVLVGTADEHIFGYVPEAVSALLASTGNSKP